MDPPVGTLRRFLFPPPRCLVCGTALEPGEQVYSGVPVCPDCLAAPVLIVPPRCNLCGRPLISETEICTLCRHRTYPFSRHWSLYEYRGSAKRLIGLYKFSRIRGLSRFFADSLAEDLGHYCCKENAVIVPVPGNPSSIRKRGWDQVLLISRLLEGSYGFPVVEVLSRRRSKTQKSLGFSSRTSNLEGKIRIKTGGRNTEVPKDVILLDDVFTTGSTASECSRVLFQGGAERVRVMTLAID